MNNKQMEMMAREHEVTAIDEKEATKMAETAVEGVKDTYKKIEDAVVGGYKRIENGVVEGYRKIETGAIEGFEKVSDKFVELLFTKEGETVEEAKKRLSEGKF